MGNPAPVSNQQVTSLSGAIQNPMLSAMAMGTAAKPGPARLQIANAQRLGNIIQGVQKADPTALASFYGVPEGTNLQPYYEATQKGKPMPTKKEGGVMTLQGYAGGGRAAKQAARAQYQQDLANDAKNAAAKKKAAAAAKAQKAQTMQTASGVTAPPYSMANAMFQQTPGMDLSQVSNQYAGVTNPLYQKAVDTLSAMKSPEEYAQASGITRQAAQGLQNASSYAPQQVAGPKSWADQGNVQQYMNPYIQAVVQLQQDQANRNFAQQQNQLRSQAAGMGAYGGSREALAEAEAQRNQNFLLNNIAQQGLANAYQQGMGQFTAEQGMAQQAAIQNQQAGLTANQANLSALANQGNLAQILAGIGGNQLGFQQGMAQSWGSAGNTAQSLAESAAAKQQQNAQNLWGGVNTATQPAINTISGLGGGSQTQANYGTKPGSWG